MINQRNKLAPVERKRKRKNDCSSNPRTLLTIISIICFSSWLYTLVVFHKHIDEDIIRGRGSHISSLSQHTTSISTSTSTSTNTSTGNTDDTTFLTMYGRHRFQKSFDALPKWLQDYFNWHKEQTSNPNSDTKYAVIHCLPKDECGGVSDRLRPLPFYLLAAKYTDRVLCIYWKKNFGLDDFLQPIPDIGIEWRCPDDIDDYINLTKRGKGQFKAPLYKFDYCQNLKQPFAPCVEEDLKKVQTTPRLVEKKYVSFGLFSREPFRVNSLNLIAQRHSYGGQAKDMNGNTYIMPSVTNWQHLEMMGDIFRVMFEPKPELAKRINAIMTKLGLVENEFISSHVRARYPTPTILHLTGELKADKDGGLEWKGKMKEHLMKVAKNSISCAHMLAPDIRKMYFVSDMSELTNTMITTDFSLGEKGHEVMMRPVGVDRDEEILHSEGNHSPNVVDYYPVFEDLLIMGASKCISHGMGSFGSFGASLAGNKCRAVHRKYGGKIDKCPNELVDNTPIVFNATEMIFGEKPGGEGKLIFDESKYVNIGAK